MDSLLALLTLHLTLQPACDTLVEGSLQVIAWQLHTASRAEAVQPLLQLIPLLLGFSVLELALLLRTLSRTTETSQLLLKFRLHLCQLSVRIHKASSLHQPLDLILEALGRKLLKLQLLAQGMAGTVIGSSRRLCSRSTTAQRIQRPKHRATQCACSKPNDNSLSLIHI